MQNCNIVWPGLCLLYDMVSKRFLKGLGVVSAEMIGAMAVFTAAIAGIVFTIRPYFRRHRAVDADVFGALHPYTNDTNTSIMEVITTLAKHQFLIPANICLILYFLFVRKRTWFSIRVAAIALSSLILMFMLKELFQRHRPEAPVGLPAAGLSFPSGHAIMSVTFYGLLIYIIIHTVKNKALRIALISFLIALILSIGFSRIYLRVHYTSDVIGGFTIGLMWLFVSLAILKRIEDYNKENNKLPARVIKGSQ
jgi:membrane-associated phospholipid phosphatase